MALCRLTRVCMVMGSKGGGLVLHRVRDREKGGRHFLNFTDVFLGVGGPWVALIISPAALGRCLFFFFFCEKVNTENIHIHTMILALKKNKKTSTLMAFYCICLLSDCDALIERSCRNNSGWSALYSKQFLQGLRQASKRPPAIESWQVGLPRQTIPLGYR